MNLDYGTIVACVVTITLSIVGAWAAMKNRIFTIEKNIELLKLDFDNYRKNNDKRTEDTESKMERILVMFEKITSSISEINYKLKSKQDRKFADDK